mgnify:CR=1 FL=1
MDALLQVVIACLLFAVVIFLLERSVKTVVVLGTAVMVLLALDHFGVLR